MKHLSRLLALIALMLCAAPAFAQTSPGLTNGQIPTATQWNALFTSKADYPGPTINLMQFYKAQGTLPCSSTTNDDAAFAAAYTYMSQHGGAYIRIPPGLCYTTATGLLLYNRSGYIADAGAVMITAVRSSSSSATTAMITLDNAYDAGWLIEGLILNGGWHYGRSPYGSAPNTDPWLDTQHGIVINNAFNGVSDATYVANNPTGYQGPNGRIINTRVVNFGGHCYSLTGAGANEYDSLVAFQCGGNGIYVNTYDNHINHVDIGSTGRSGIVFTGSGSENEVSGKVWFNGFRFISGDQSGLSMEYFAGSNVWTGLIQDSFCHAIYDAGQNNQFRGQVGWAGQSNSGMCSNLAVYQAGSGVIAPLLDITVSSNSTTWPNVTYLVNDSANSLTKAQIKINEVGMPNDSTSIWNTAWFAGTLDFSNLITVNAVQRGFRAWQPGPNYNNTVTQLAMTIVDTSQGGPIGMTLYPATNYMDTTVGTGGWCVRSSLYSSPCAFFVDHTGALTVNNAGSLASLGSGAFANVSTSGANLPLMSAGNTWSGVQTFNLNDLLLKGSSTGTTNLTTANSSSSNYTVTVPAITDTLATLTATQTLTNKTLSSPTISSAAMSNPTISMTTAGGYAMWQVTGSNIGCWGVSDTYAVDGLCYNNAYASLTLTAGQGGLCILGQNNGTYSSPCTISVDKNGALLINKSGTLTALGTAAFANLGTSGGGIPQLWNANTWGGTQTFTDGALIMAGSSTGTTTLHSPNAGATSYTVTIPAITDT